jgi:hypothetical protein
MYYPRPPTLLRAHLTGDPSSSWPTAGSFLGVRVPDPRRPHGETHADLGSATSAQTYPCCSCHPCGCRHVRRQPWGPHTRSARAVPVGPPSWGFPARTRSESPCTCNGVTTHVHGLHTLDVGPCYKRGHHLVHGNEPLPLALAPATLCRQSPWSGTLPTWSRPTARTTPLARDKGRGTLVEGHRVRKARLLEQVLDQLGERCRTTTTHRRQWMVAPHQHGACACL